MMKPKTNASYQTLIRAVKAALNAGIIDVQRLVEYQRVKTYWTIGYDIRRIVESSGGTLVLDDSLYRRISVDVSRQLSLDLSIDTLKRTVQFAGEYPVFPKDTPLTFTHYLALMRVTDPAKRLQLEKQAAREGMTSPQLKEAVNLFNQPALETIAFAAGKLTFERGEPYIYYLRSYQNLTGKDEPCVDCGFKIHLPLNGSVAISARGIKTGQTRYVRSVKTDGHYELRLAVRKRAGVYTYAARVIRVIDGDTLDALIDAGFGMCIYERFRFKGIDAPEIRTAAGLKARDFLLAYLAKCPVIIVRTFKAEMYGRWLGDVFALPGSSDPFQIASEGLYLNQMLIDQSLAGLYK